MERHLEILHTVAETVSRSLDVEEVLRTALDALTHVTGHEISSLHLLSEDGATLHLRGDRGLSERLREVNRELAVGTGLIGRVAATGETLNIKNAAQSPNLLPAAKSAVQRDRMRGFLCVAIHGRGRILGTLSLGRQIRDAFSDRRGGAGGGHRRPDRHRARQRAALLRDACASSRSSSARRPSSSTPRSSRRSASWPPAWPTRSTTR